jgi:hypothetical protein
MRDHRSRLLLVLITATAILFAVYIGVPNQAALIAALISGGVDLVTLATMFLEGDQQKLEKWADDLASQVELAWSHRRDILLGGATGLNTRFERYRSLEAAATGVIFEKGNWSDIQEVFLSIPARKLIIVGEAGSGKTLITLQLVTSLLESRKTKAKDAETVFQLLARVIRIINSVTGQSERPRSSQDDLQRIPVPISVIGWDGEKPLSDWLISSLRTTYSVPRRQAAALVSHGYILPVLDGLDEAASVTNKWRPTLRILYRLNTDYGGRGEDGLRPLVITCRTDKYRELPDPEGDPLLSRRLVGAPVVAMLPLTETDIINYLSQQAETSSRRIDRLARYLVDGDNPVVATAVENPLVLTLAARAAMSDAINYEHLSQLSAKNAVRRYFIAMFARSTTALFPKYFGRPISINTRERSQDDYQGAAKYYYDPASVERWLYYIAEYLRITASRSGDLREPELSPQDLWKVAEYHQRPAHRIHVVMAVVVTLLTGAFGAEASDGLAGAAYWAGTTVLVSYFGFRVSRLETPKLSRVDFRRIWRGKAAVYLLPAVIAVGCLAGLLGYQVSHALSVGVTEGIAAAALTALLAGLSRGLARAVEPLDGLTNDLRFGLVVGIVGAIAIGFPGGLTGGLWSHLHLTGILTKPGSQVLTFLIVIPGGIVLGSGGWLRLQIAARLSGGRLLPTRPISFLRWAEVTGLLRGAGTSYQFRHEDLREWLLSSAAPADHPEHR